MPHVPRALFAVVMTPFVLALKISAILGRPRPLLRALFRGVYPSRVRALEGFEPGPRDVFVTTFAKSGTNLALQITQQISYLGQAEFEHIHALVPWPEATMPGLVALNDMRVVEDSPTKLRVIKTHASHELVPYDARAKYLTILRDPKEVTVSAYHFFLGVFGVKAHISPDQWAELAVQPGLVCQLWAAHTASTWAVRHRPNHLIIEFGELLGDRCGSIERIAALMGVALTDAQLDEVLERSSFGYMRARDAQFGPPRMPLVKPAVKMIRRGQNKDSGELLRAEQRAEIDRYCRAELLRLGSDFPYDEFFA